MGSAPAQATCPAGEQLDFSQIIYDTWFDEVVRWARALGGPEADLDDLSQEVFLVVRRKLPSFDGRNLGGWLHRITAHTVSDWRRRAWFRRLWRRPAERLPEELAGPGADPAAQLEQREARQLLYQRLGRLSDKHRRAFILFEIEGYSGEEIAAMENIPVATVWTRLHHARRAFLGHVARMQKIEAR